MIDLGAPVRLHDADRTHDEYCATVTAESEEAAAWLTRPDATWTIPDGLRLKVADSGALLPYPGDSVVLPLDSPAIVACRRTQRALRAGLGDALADALQPSTFHVTLHDLTHGPQATGARLEENAARCRERFARIARALDADSELARVTLVPTRVYPSVNVSIVLGLVPATDRDFRTLMNAYTLFDDVVRLSYWPRLHVTLDYLLPRAVDPARVFAALPPPPGAPMVVDMRQLAYQRFKNMNDYRTEFTVADLPHRD